MLDQSSYGAIVAWVDARFLLTLETMPENVYAAGSFSADDLQDFNGVYVWYMAKRAIVRTPTWMTERLIQELEQRVYLTGQHPRVLLEESFWREVLGEQVVKVVGPAYEGFADYQSFYPADHRAARQLILSDPHDKRMLREFIVACPADDWQDSAISSQHAPIFGVVRHGALVAAASAPLQQPRLYGIRAIGVATLPEYRGSDVGLTVVSALSDYMLHHHVWTNVNLKLRYQTLRSNLASVAIARRLGFEHVATSLAVRLRVPLPS